MSLINDALKKAQKQRTEGSTPATELTTPSVSTEPLHRVARREKPAGFRSQLLLIGGGALAAVVLLGVGAVFFLKSSDKPAATPPPAPVAVTPAPAPTATPAASIPVAASAAATPATLPTVAATTAPAPAPTTPAPAQPLTLPPVVASPTPAQTPATNPVADPAASQYVIPTPAVATASTTAAPAATERPKASTRMIGMIDHYKVGGIRVAGAESKVLMNDKVYRINDIVDHELGIKLTAIEAKALTFEDARGAVYTRYF